MAKDAEETQTSKAQTEASAAEQTPQAKKRLLSPLIAELKTPEKAPKPPKSHSAMLMEQALMLE